jgi:hypothetical protein
MSEKGAPTSVVRPGAAARCTSFATVAAARLTRESAGQAAEIAPPTRSDRRSISGHRIERIAIPFFPGWKQRRVQ